MFEFTTCSASPRFCRILEQHLIILMVGCSLLLCVEYQQMAHARLEADVSGYLDSSQEVVLTEQQRRQVQQMHRAEERCRSQLLGVTELFQDICLPYKLWEACLLLLHVSKHDGLDLILRLWRSIVYR